MEIKREGQQGQGEDEPVPATLEVDAELAVAAPAPRPGMLSFKPVGALIAGLAVLRYMSTATSSLPLSQITRDLKLNPSTCLNILRTLTQENYVLFDPQTKLYSMGLGVLELVGGAISQGTDMRAIRSVTDLIAASENVTVTLWRRVRHDRMVLAVESLPPGNMSIKMNVGQRLPLLVGAAGRLMAAFSDLGEVELSSQFQAIRLERRQSFRQFMAEVAEARARGWAVDDGHFTEGAASVAVPVLNERDEAVFAFTATMFSAQFSLDRAETLAEELRRPAALLGSALPYL